MSEQSYDDRFELITLSDVEPENIEWVWKSRIPRGKLTILDGDPENLKTTLLIDIAARVSTGRPMPDGTPSDLGGPKNVILLMGEDGVADTIAPRVRAAGGDLSRIQVFRIVVEERDSSGKVKTARIPNLKKDMDPFFAEMLVEKDVGFMVVDPINAYLGTTDTHKDSVVRDSLNSLLAVAEKSGTGIVGVRHLNKNESSSNPLMRGLGSIGFTAVTRSLLLAGPNPRKDEAGKILAVSKLNIGRHPASSMRYDLEEVTLSWKGKQIETIRIEWLGTSDATAEEVLGSKTRRKRTDKDVAEDFLRFFLAERGWVPAKSVKRCAERYADVSESVLNKVSGDLLDLRKRKKGLTGGWEWKLAPIIVENRSQLDGENGSTPLHTNRPSSKMDST